jgi:hypothetical protein
LGARVAVQQAWVPMEAPKADPEAEAAETKAAEDAWVSDLLNSIREAKSSLTLPAAA